MLRLRNINKFYQVGAHKLHVLHDVNIDVATGEHVSIMGSSGSGKSTLLNILGILDAYDSGEYWLGDQIIKNLNETQAAHYRNRFIGFLERVGLTAWAEHRPAELSGGQKQRIAIARALITQPRLILADEPTGALDSETSGQIMDLLGEINRSGITLLVVTHEADVAERGARTIRLKDGQIVTVTDPEHREQVRQEAR